MKNSEHSRKEAQARFDAVMAQLKDKPFEDRVKDRSRRLRCLSKTSGERVEEFNVVLSGGCFAGSPLIGTLSTSPALAKQTAAILCKLSLETGFVKWQKHLGEQHLGWKNLNRDAKGWCKALLLSHPPGGATAEELRDLLIAKQFASVVADHLLPQELRAVAVPPPMDKPDLLDKPVDE